MGNASISEPETNGGTSSEGDFNKFSHHSGASGRQKNRKCSVMGLLRAQ